MNLINKKQKIMKRKTKSHVKVIMLLFIALLMFNCQNDENLPDQLQNKIETVSIDEAKNFLIHSRSNSSAKSTNNEFENLEFNKIAQEKIKGTDQLLTVIPFTTNNDFENNRILMLKIDNEIKSVIFSMYPDENSSKESFSGKLFSYSLDGNFISGFRAKNGIIVGQFFENTSSLKTNIDNGKIPTLTRKTPSSSEALDGVYVQNNYRNTVHALDMFGYSSIFGNDIFGGGFNDYGGVDYYSWDAGGGDYSSNDSTNIAVPPSCESFNFVNTTSLWQVALVKNVTFKVFLVNNKGIEILHVISFPQPISFGVPTNIQVGNTDINPGIAANTSARALQKAMQDVVDKYGRTRSEELTVRLYFEERLKYNYPLYLPGARVNFNANDNIPATEYKANIWTAGDCN